MNIAYDAKRLFTNQTGLGNYSRTLVVNMSKYQPENQYTLFATRYKSAIDKRFEDPLKYKIQSNQSALPNGLWRSYFIADTINNNSNKINLYHGLSNELPFKKISIPSVVTIHDIIYRFLPDTYPYFDRIMYHYKTKKAVQNATKIVSISNQTTRDLIEHYNVPPDKITTIYQACLPMYYQVIEKAVAMRVKEKYDLPDEFLLFVGALSPRKNLYNLLIAYQSLDKPVQLPLYIVGNVGEKQYTKKVIEFIKQKKLGKKVIFLPRFQDYTDLRYVYHLATVVAYPSFYEGFGLPVAEALLSGTPVITSKTSSMPEAAGPGAVLIEPGSIDSIAEGLKKILSDDSLRQELSKKGKIYAQNSFNPEILSQQMNELYQSIIQN